MHDLADIVPKPQGLQIQGIVPEGALRAASWWPTEELLLVRGLGTTGFVEKPHGLCLESQGDILELGGVGIGRFIQELYPGHGSSVDGTPRFIPTPWDPASLQAVPPQPTGPMDKPVGIPHLPSNGLLRITLHFTTGNSLVLVGPSHVSLRPLPDQCFALLQSTQGSIVRGTAAYESVEGVGTLVACHRFEGPPTIHPGLEGQVDMTLSLRLTTAMSRQEPPHAIPLGREDQPLGSVDLPLPQGSPGDLLLGLGAEVNTLEAPGPGSPIGPGMVARGRLFDLEEYPVGEYLGAMRLLGPLNLDSQPPNLPSGAEDADPAHWPMPPVAGAMKARFNLRTSEHPQGESFVWVGQGSARVIPIVGDARLMMVFGSGLVVRGTADDGRVSGVGSVQGSTLLAPDFELTPGAQLPFETLFELRVVDSRGSQTAAPVSAGPASVGPASTGMPPMGMASPAAGPSLPHTTRPAPPLQPPTPGIPPGVDPLTDQLGSVDQLFARIANYLLTTVTGHSVTGHSVTGHGTPDDTTPRPIVVHGQPVGFHLDLPLHRLSLGALPPEATGWRAHNQAAAHPSARLHLECLWIPEEFVARPPGATGATEPPPTPFDPHRSQRLMVRRGALHFDDAQRSALTLFGTGRSFPEIQTGQGRVSVGFTLLPFDGTGAFQDRPGMVVGNGLLGMGQPSSWSWLVRLADPTGDLLVESLAPLSPAVETPDPTSTVFAFIGNNDTRESTGLIESPPGHIVGAHLRQEQHLISTGFEILDGVTPDLRSHTTHGPLVSRMQATMHFDPTQPAPVAFTTDGSRFTLSDPDGHPVGTFSANIVEARGFHTELPGAPTPVQRGSALAPITDPTGILEGAQGLVTVINWISIFPRQVSGFFLLRLLDPDGRFRTRIGDLFQHPTGNSPWER